MPAYGKNLTPAETTALVAFLGSLHPAGQVPARDASGVVRNAVLIGHGTGGSGTQFLSAQFAGVLFGPGQLLDATKYFIILPDGIGHGRGEPGPVGRLPF